MHLINYAPGIKELLGPGKHSNVFDEARRRLEEERSLLLYDEDSRRQSEDWSHLSRQIVGAECNCPCCRRED